MQTRTYLKEENISYVNNQAHNHLVMAKVDLRWNHITMDETQVTSIQNLTLIQKIWCLENLELMYYLENSPKKTLVSNQVQNPFAISRKVDLNWDHAIVDQIHVKNT